MSSDEIPLSTFIPTKKDIENSNISHTLKELDLPNYKSLHSWSVQKRADYWTYVVKKLGIQFSKPAKSVWSEEKQSWFEGAELNIVQSAFQANSSKTAIIEMSETRPARKLSYGELESLTKKIAHSAWAWGLKPRDSVAICMPLHVEAVAIYFGLIWTGCTVVSIAESFSAGEIKTRLKLTQAKAIFTQDKMLRSGKEINLFEKICEAEAPRAVVMSITPESKFKLRKTDTPWSKFLINKEKERPESCKANAPMNILFSSGTTGDPKVIPWTHLSPIKSAADAFFHHDLHPSDVVTWPTSLGWMMGPWLLFATFLNKATLALFDGAPTTEKFGRFVQDAKVTVLGLVPSLVKAWRQSACMEKSNWKHIKLFSSTGECSNPSDMSYLMSLADGRPIIEYCGGTETSGAYLTSTIVEKVPASQFTTPAMGIDFVILDDKSLPAKMGEVFFVPPSIGLSEHLLAGGDHEKIYFTGTPKGPHGEKLRRHGDAIERLPTGNYRAHGRSDDTMNLGGIKVSSAEIERALENMPQIKELAAFAASPVGGGPSLLVIYVVISGKEVDLKTLQKFCQEKISKNLNPLFKIHEIVPIASLPRTASNKVMRRELHRDYLARNKL